VPFSTETSVETSQRLELRIGEAEGALKRIFSKGFRRWIITYSGGKDSTAAVCLAFELVKRGEIDPTAVDVVYADTRMEIPLLRAQAFRFLDTIRKRSTAFGLPFRCHVRTPDVRKGFWYLLLGKGYPPPHQRFRWCTRRLKIEPMRDLVASAGKSGKTCIITGVRFNESENRDRALARACKRGGECGQGCLGFSSLVHGQRGLAHEDPIRSLSDWTRSQVWVLDVYSREARQNNERVTEFFQEHVS